MQTLITGGLGYIGSHTTISLIEAGHEVIIVDNLSNSKLEVLDRLEKITGTKPVFYNKDVTHPDLSEVFDNHQIDSVMHFAAYKAVGESAEKPLEYYQNNIGGLLNLLEVMRNYNVFRFIFSSSCTVYGTPEKLPVTEDMPLSQATSPYGQTKLEAEVILRDLAASDERWQITSLRYFNPIGAHASGLIGEDPTDIPNNLLPYVLKVATGELEKVRVWGNDYPTPDGTGIRDYIHVVDLAAGHLATLPYQFKPGKVGVFNLGTGQGSSVLEIIQAVEQATGKNIPYEFCPRRAGDIAKVYGDASKAEKELGWKTKLSVADACRDSWNWVSGSN